jgi:hypothetical protein
VSPTLASGSRYQMVSDCWFIKRWTSMLINYEKPLNTVECSSSELSFGGEMDCGRKDDAPNPERAALFPTPIAHNLIGHGVHAATHPDLQHPPIKGCRRRGCNILATISLSLTLPITKVCSRSVRGWLLFIKTEFCFARVVQLTIGRKLCIGDGCNVLR